MMAMIGDWISFFAGMSLLFFGGLVIVAFRPKRWGRKSAEGTLERAIFWSFLAAVGNTFYWQVLGHPVVHLGIASVPALRTFGDFMDLLFKGGAAWAGYLHLRAIWETLPENERRIWGVLEMAFYPRRRKCLAALTRRFRRNQERSQP